MKYIIERDAVLRSYEFCREDEENFITVADGVAALKEHPGKDIEFIHLPLVKVILPDSLICFIINTLGDKYSEKK